MQSIIQKISPPNSIVTTKSTYEKYVAQGLWKPKGPIKFLRYRAGIILCDCQLDGKKNIGNFVEKNIVIENWF